MYATMVKQTSPQRHLPLCLVRNGLRFNSNGQLIANIVILLQLVCTFILK